MGKRSACLQQREACAQNEEACEQPVRRPLVLDVQIRKRVCAALEQDGGRRDDPSTQYARLQEQ